MSILAAQTTESALREGTHALLFSPLVQIRKEKIFIQNSQFQERLIQVTQQSEWEIG
jgi:hypothetical protein